MMSTILLWLTILAARAAPLSADAAVASALERSAELAAAAAAVDRATGALRAAEGLRQDPMLSGSAAVVGTAWQLSVRQPVSLSGAGRADRAAARHALDAAAARRQRVQLEVAAEARRSWIDAVVAQQRAALATRALAVAEGVADAARQREAVGEASLLDLRLARLRVEEARTAWMAAVVEEGRSTADLAARIGASAPELALPDDPLAGAPPPSPGAVAQRSDLIAAEAAVAAARAAAARERSSSLPPVQLGAFVEQEGDDFRAGPSVSLTLPLWRANVDGRAGAEADLAAASARGEAAARHVAAEQHTTQKVSDVLEQAAGQQAVDVPAEAQAALDSVGLGYTRGELDVLSTALLQAEIIDGHLAWIEGRRLVAESRLALLLAVEDPRLLSSPLSPAP